MTERDYHQETIAPHVAAALKEAGIDPTGTNDPAFWAQGLEPLRLGMQVVRQAQRNADPEARKSILADESFDREIVRLKIGARALELLRDDARKTLGVAPPPRKAASRAPREAEAPEPEAVAAAEADQPADPQS